VGWGERERGRKREEEERRRIHILDRTSFLDEDPTLCY
jgi:hypothetical protein